MIFYTAITNGYDELAPPPKSNAKFICFHDGDKPDTEGWEYREIEIDEDCPVRKSYHPKHCPHLYFEPNTVTVWIDAVCLPACPALRDAVTRRGVPLFHAAHDSGERQSHHGRPLRSR